MKPYKLRESDFVTILPYFGQFMHVCNFNEVSKGVVVWPLQFSVPEPSLLSSTVSMKLTNTDDVPSLGRNETKKQKYTFSYFEAV